MLREIESRSLPASGVVEESGEDIASRIHIVDLHYPRDTSYGSNYQFIMKSV